MSPFYLGVVVGIFIGAFLGIFVLGLCVAAARGEKEHGSVGCDNGEAEEV